MAVYRIEFTRSARKEFERLPLKLRSKIVEALQLLSQNPYSELLKVKKLKSSEILFRFRIGDHRIIYEIRDEKLVIVVIKVGHRGDVYRQL